MERNGEQNIAAEEVGQVSPSTSVETVDMTAAKEFADIMNQEALEQPTKSKPKAEKSSSHPRDQGDWKYRPWHGHDHWVNDRTKASTFKQPL
jgi:hypothetical protein